MLGHLSSIFMQFQILKFVLVNNGIITFYKDV